ncbi:hypothetical protein, partial [Streptococcus sobrinus]|uniref:hypothetical protein n=1 Tax=Streptococcus sobrinus TaxID=1310 RepID=UPI001C3F7C37
IEIFYQTIDNFNQAEPHLSQIAASWVRHSQNELTNARFQVLRSLELYRFLESESLCLDQIKPNTLEHQPRKIR